MTDQRMAWSSAVSVAIFITCAAFFFVAVGFSIPFWVSTTYTFTDSTTGEETKFSTHVSIWYVMSCISGKADSCKSGGIEPKFDGADPTFSTFSGDTQQAIVDIATTALGSYILWSILQIVSTIGVGLIALTTLILVCCRCAGIHSQCWFITALIILMMGDIIVLGITILGAIGYGTLFSFAPSVTAETFPWSLLCYGIGGFLGVIAAILLFVITCAWRKYGAYEEDDQVSFDDMPMSDRKPPPQRYGYDNPRYPDPYDPKKEYYQYDNDRRYNSRESGKYKDYIDDYRDNPRSNYRDTGYSRDYRDTRDTRDDKYYAPSASRSYAADNMYRPYSQYRY